MFWRMARHPSHHSFLPSPPPLHFSLLDSIPAFFLPSLPTCGRQTFLLTPTLYSSPPPASWWVRFSSLTSTFSAPICTVSTCRVACLYLRSLYFLVHNIGWFGVLDLLTMHRWTCCTMYFVCQHACFGHSITLVSFGFFSVPPPSHIDLLLTISFSLFPGRFSLPSPFSSPYLPSPSLSLLL